MLVLAVFLFVNCLLVQSRNLYKVEEADKHFEAFKVEHGKQYESEEEEQYRFQIFVENLNEINELNEEGNAIYGINKFSDLTKEEFLDFSTGLHGGINSGKCTPAISNMKAPDAFDWRSKNVVSRVKDQGRCGSCWAFGAAGAVESHYAIKYNKMQEVSEQQLVDCDKSSLGCSGTYDLANPFTYFVANGAESEQAYPYKGSDGQCQYNSGNVKVRLSGCRSIKLNKDEEKLKNFLHQYGPATIAIAADVLQNYKSGIISNSQCKDPNVDHAVLLVGYGTENGTPFWIIKNSWGTRWGEQGYFRIQRGVDCLAITRSNPVQPIIA